MGQGFESGVGESNERGGEKKSKGRARANLETSSSFPLQTNDADE